MSAHDRFEALAHAWHDGGKPDAMLLEGYDLLVMHCWSYSSGAKHDGVSEQLKAFLDASRNARPEDWLDDLMSDRESCRDCGERYRVENLGLCTHCHSTYCYACTGQHQQSPNGNAACHCGGELVG